MQLQSKSLNPHSQSGVSNRILLMYVCDDPWGAGSGSDPRLCSMTVMTANSVMQILPWFVYIGSLNHAGRESCANSEGGSVE